MTSRKRKKVGAFAVAVVISLVLGACAGDDAGGASQGTTKLANPTQTPASTGGAGMGAAETEPTETGPTGTGPNYTGQPSGPVSAAEELRLQAIAAGRRGMCSDGARFRLELRDMGDRIEMRYGVHQSPVGHEWLIHFRHLEHNIEPVIEHVFFRGTRVASDSGVFVVETGFPVWPVNDGIVSKAVDRQTGQVCKSFTWYR